MADDAPQVLLQSALEKIVYFEARLGQLQAELAASRQDASRLKDELSKTAQCEVELRRELAGMQVQVERLRVERSELQRVHEASRQERAMLIAKLLEASQIHHAGEDVDFDLASFISTLRGEVLARSAPPSASPSPSPILGAPPASAERVTAGPLPTRDETPARSPYSSDSGAWTREEQAPRSPQASSGAQVTAHAQRLADQGRLAVSAEEQRSLSRQDASTPRSEETLLEFSIRELRAVDVSARVRAAERLKALGQSASAPALAAALHQEREPAAQVALLQAFSTVANAAGAPVVEPLLSAPSAEVRIAALKALLTLEPAQAVPHLSAAVKDPDRTVRRRASLLALGLEEKAAITLGEEAVRDSDPEVRGLAALALGAAGGERARSLLSQMLADHEVKVRQAAAQSLSRILGRDVTGLVHLDEAQRRRELRRLSSAPVNPVRTALPPTAAVLQQRAALLPVVPRPEVAGVHRGAAPQEPRAVAAHAQGTGGQFPAFTASPARPAAVHAPQRPSLAAVHSGGQRAPLASVVPLAAAAARIQQHRVAVVAPHATNGLALAVAPPPEPDEALCSGVLTELRAALRGRTEPELARALGVSGRTAEEAVALLCARGQVVRRGLKVYLP